MVLTKVAHNDAKSFKKIGCIFPHRLGGGGVRPWCGKFHKIFIFLTLYPSLSILLYYSQFDANVKKVHCFNITNELTAQQTENLENY